MVMRDNPVASATREIPPRFPILEHAELDIGVLLAHATDEESDAREAGGDMSHQALDVVGPDTLEVAPLLLEPTL